MISLWVAVIGDDLTGICDTGAPFASAGLHTLGLVHPASRFTKTPEVLLVNTQSRRMEPQDASQAVKQATEGLKKENQPRWLFKKIDTALRGNLSAEVISAMEASGVCLALLVAAIPKANRSTVRGCQFLRGKPITDSILGKDKLNPDPVVTSRVADLFQGLPNVVTEEVGLDKVRSESFVISPPSVGRVKTIRIFDAETERDIDRIVAASMKLEPSSFLFVGASGLAGSFARSLQDLPFAKPFPETADKIIRTGRILIVSGSPHPVSRSQIAYLERRGSATIFELDPEKLLQHPERCLQGAIKECKAALERSGRAVLTLGDDKRGIVLPAQELSLSLSRLVQNLLDRVEVEGLVLVGGETSYAICRALGIETVEIYGAISSVAAYGRPLGSSEGMKVLVTKGGSLGKEDLLEGILNFLSK